MNKKQSEIVFLYDVELANPNGDPTNDNGLKYDEESGFVYVTDIRLKRTIRDYLMRKEDQTIFFIRGLTNVSKATDVNEKPKKTKADRFNEAKVDRLNKDFGGSIKLAIEKCIDLRLFGFTIAIGKKDENKNKKKSDTESSESNSVEANVSIIGPVQFSIGSSMHAVKVDDFKITSVMPNQKNKSGGEFGDKYLVYYALIMHNGAVNRNLAYVQNIPLKEEDLNLMYKAMWRGVNSLMTTSKHSHSRLLLVVDYKDGYYYGDLKQYLKLIPLNGIEGRAIKGPEDYVIELKDFIAQIGRISKFIDVVRIQEDPYINFVIDGKKTRLSDEIKKIGIPLEDLALDEKI
jgi:CRISPR-associated protein Csh2